VQEFEKVNNEVLPRAHLGHKARVSSTRDGKSAGMETMDASAPATK